MNNFINVLESSDIDYFEENILNLQCFKDFLYNIDVTYGFYHDYETGLVHVVIKCKGNKYVLMVDFDDNKDDNKFVSIYKSYVSISKSKKHRAFEFLLGRVLMEYFHPAHCSGRLTIHWGKNEMEVKDKEYV